MTETLQNFVILFLVDQTVLLKFGRYDDRFLCTDVIDHQTCLQEFYNFFSVYITTRSYTWLEKYDVRGENRRIARLAEKGSSWRT